MTEDTKAVYEETKRTIYHPKTKTRKRLTWDQYFMEIMDAVSLRSTCDRGRSGCVIAKNNEVVATGYVGAPAGLPHCDDIGHLMKYVSNGTDDPTSHCHRTSHAEQNAICQAAKSGRSVEGSTLYCRMTPCPEICAKMIINCGIKKVVCEKKYKLWEDTHEMFEKAGIEISYFFDEVKKYD